MKGIVLAGGTGTRLFPSTKVVCKQLLPIYDKPMIYYPLSILMLAGIRDILIISTPYDLPMFERLLGDGSQIGINIQYKIQQNPKGIAEAFLIGKDFIKNEPVCLILGDNIFYGDGITTFLQKASNLNHGATIFGYYVNHPQSYGVVEFDKSGKVLTLEEKPKNPKSNYAVVGLYFYDKNVVEYAEILKPSLRGELEITDLNILYLKQGNLNVELLGRGYAWLDTGTHKSMIDAANFVKTIEERQGLKIACLEEISYRMKYISAEQLKKLAEPLLKSGYGEYLLKIIDQE